MKKPYDIKAIETTYEAIKRETKASQHDTLERIHGVCKDYADRGGVSFTVANIARLGSDKNIPKETSLRHASAAPYRALIKAWSEQTKGAPKKVKVRGQYDWVERIQEHDIVFLVKDLINENLSLKKELKDCKDFKAMFGHDGILDLSKPSQHTLKLIPLEWKALHDTLNEDRFKKRGLHRDKQGRVLDENNKELLPAGFLTALEKIVALDEEEYA